MTLWHLNRTVGLLSFTPWDCKPCRALQTAWMHYPRQSMLSWGRGATRLLLTQLDGTALWLFISSVTVGNLWEPSSFPNVTFPIFLLLFLPYGKSRHQYHAAAYEWLDLPLLDSCYFQYGTKSAPCGNVMYSASFTNQKSMSQHPMLTCHISHASLGERPL